MLRGGVARWGTRARGCTRRSCAPRTPPCRFGPRSVLSRTPRRRWSNSHALTRDPRGGRHSPGTRKCSEDARGGGGPPRTSVGFYRACPYRNPLSFPPLSPDSQDQPRSPITHGDRSRIKRAADRSSIIAKGNSACN